MKPVFGVLHDLLYSSTVLLPKLVQGLWTGQYSQPPFYPLGDNGDYDITPLTTTTTTTTTTTSTRPPLVVCIHGLQGHPVVWTDYVKQIKDELQDCEFFIPYVRAAGNCPLDEATEPIERAVRQLTAGERKHDPIFIIGTSNGARIASRLEYVLRDHCTNVTVFSIAGLHHGTTLVNLLNRWSPIRYVSERILHRSVLEEMPRDSEHAIELMKQVNRTPPTDASRHYHVYVSHCDTRIFPAGQVPEITHTRGAVVYSYQGHNSIVKRALPDIKEVIVETWRKYQRQVQEQQGQAGSK